MASETCHEAVPFPEAHHWGLLLGAVANTASSYFGPPPVPPDTDFPILQAPTGMPHLLQPWEPPLTQSLSQGRLPRSQESRE